MYAASEYGNLGMQLWMFFAVIAAFVLVIGMLCNSDPGIYGPAALIILFLVPVVLGGILWVIYMITVSINGNIDNTQNTVIEQMNTSTITVGTMDDEFIDKLMNDMPYSYAVQENGEPDHLEKDKKFTVALWYISDSPHTKAAMLTFRNEKLMKWQVFSDVEGSRKRYKDNLERERQRREDESRRKASEAEEKRKWEEAENN